MVRDRGLTKGALVRLVAMLIVVVCTSLWMAGWVNAREAHVCHGCLPPVVVCGQTLWPRGFDPHDFTRPGRYPLANPLYIRPQAPTFLRFVSSCAAGVTVNLKPRNGLRIEREAFAKDGKLAAIGVIPRRVGTVRIIVGRPHERTTVVVVHIRRV
jgi:hypothetical protein